MINTFIIYNYYLYLTRISSKAIRRRAYFAIFERNIIYSELPLDNFVVHLHSCICTVSYFLFLNMKVYTFSKKYFKATPNDHALSEKSLKTPSTPFFSFQKHLQTSIHLTPVPLIRVILFTVKIRFKG